MLLIISHIFKKVKHKSIIPIFSHNGIPKHATIKTYMKNTPNINSNSANIQSQQSAKDKKLFLK